MRTQIPLFRAKKIDSDERVEGFLSHRSNGIFVIKGFPIDPSTLEISFDGKYFNPLDEIVKLFSEQDVSSINEALEWCNIYR